jgi:hypothetical protein
MRSELRGCVSGPIANVTGKGQEEGVKLDQEKVEEFLEKLGVGIADVVSKSGQLASNLQVATSASESSLQEQLIDKGQYLYCKAVVDKVEREK